jgi:hypothetical protein
MPANNHKHTVYLDVEDNELLEQLERLEKLSKSDLFRRGLRTIAKEHGLWPPAEASSTSPADDHPQAQSA